MIDESRIEVLASGLRDSDSDHVIMFVHGKEGGAQAQMSELLLRPI